MEPRYKRLSSQLGKTINDMGAHMPHAVVGIIRKRRTRKHETGERLNGGSRVKPLTEYNPYPVEFTPASM